MKKEEFKKRWDSDENGGGLTMDDVADCAKEWGLYSRPRTAQIDTVLAAVLAAADCKWEEEND
jgi:hypothetical protein